MEQTSLFVEHNDDVVNEMQEREGIDHVIKTVTGVARRLSKEKDKTQENDDMTELEAVDKRSSVRTGEDEACAKKNDVVKDAGDQTDWYEIAVREGITVTTRLGGDAQARSVANCAAMVTEPDVQESNASRAT